MGSAIATAEPLPSRLDAIAGGTGEIDCVYHLSLETLLKAVEAVGSAVQKSALDRLVRGKRVADLLKLPRRLLD